MWTASPYIVFVGHVIAKGVPPSVWVRAVHHACGCVRDTSPTTSATLPQQLNALGPQALGYIVAAQPPGAAVVPPPRRLVPSAHRYTAGCVSHPTCALTWWLYWRGTARSALSAWLAQCPSLPPAPRTPRIVGNDNQRDGSWWSEHILESRILPAMPLCGGGTVTPIISRAGARALCRPRVSFATQLLYLDSTCILAPTLITCGALPSASSFFFCGRHRVM